MGKISCHYDLVHLRINERGGIHRAGDVQVELCYINALLHVG